MSQSVELVEIERTNGIVDSYTVSEAAKLIGFSADKITELVNAGAIGFIKDEAIRLSEDDIVNLRSWQKTALVFKKNTSPVERLVEEAESEGKQSVPTVRRSLKVTATAIRTAISKLKIRPYKITGKSTDYLDPKQIKSLEAYFEQKQTESFVAKTKKLSKQESLDSKFSGNFTQINDLHNRLKKLQEWSSDSINSICNGVNELRSVVENSQADFLTAAAKSNSELSDRIEHINTRLEETFNAFSYQLVGFEDRLTDLEEAITKPVIEKIHQAKPDEKNSAEKLAENRSLVSKDTPKSKIYEGNVSYELVESAYLDYLNYVEQKIISDKGQKRLAKLSGDILLSLQQSYQTTKKGATVSYIKRALHSYSNEDYFWMLAALGYLAEKEQISMPKPKNPQNSGRIWAINDLKEYRGGLLGGKSA